MKKFTGVALLAGLALAGAALAQVYPVPMLSAIGPTDLFHDIPNGAVSPNNVYVTAAQLGNYSQSLPGNNPENAIIGGDFTTNLFQNLGQGTTVVHASPATVAYGAADEFFDWGGTNTPITTSKQTGAADITQAYGASLRVNKASGAGVVQVCTAQEIETINSIQFQGQTAELDFHALAGAGFSAASSNLAVYILTGTGTDQGSSDAAFIINAGGGGGTGWTGTNLIGGTTGFLIPISTTWARYTVAAPIPASATEIVVAICYTPVGTGTSTDYFELAGVQLVRNSALTAVAGANGAVLNTNDPRAKAFSRRSAATETVLQQRYLYEVVESKTAILSRGMCAASSTSLDNCVITFPVQMRAAPAMTLTAGFEVSATTASTSAAVCSALTLSATLTGNAASPNNVILDCVPTGGGAAAGSAVLLWDIGTGSATGIIKAAAQL